MAEDAVAYVSIVPESSGVGAKIARQFDGDGVGAQMSNSVSKGFLARVGSIGLGITKVVGGAVAISGGLIAGLALKGGLARSLDIQGAEAKLSGLGHSTKSVSAIMDNALASVKGTAFGLGDAATVAATAVAANVKPGKDLTRYLSLMADAATIAGTSMGDMGQIFNQVAARGSLTGDVVNQLQQRGIPVLQLVADQYGVTAGAAADMVSAGQVDFATFEKAIEAGMGGAALKSGNTAAGAFANVQAALGRLGQGFTDPIVAAAPELFNAIGKATDNAASALKPYADKFAAWITPAIGSLSTWIASIDFTAVIANVKTFFGSVKDAASGTADAFSGMDLGGVFGTLFAILNPLMPIFIAVAQGLGSVAGSIGKLIGAGIQLLPPIIDAFAGALGFLGDNSGLVLPLIIAIAAAMLVYKASQIASNFATLASIPSYTARTAVMLASIPASQGAAAATTLATAAVERQKLGLIRAAAAWVAQKVAMVGGKAVMLAGAAATAVVTAAQWLWNAAMSANPIGLVILAIAALIAIIILIVVNWQTIVDFLYGVWNAVVTWLMGVLTTFGAFWASVWANVVAFFVTIWTNIVAFVTAYINLVASIITNVVNFIVGVWNAVWGAISSFFVGIWNGIVSFVSAYINTVASIIAAVVAGISGTWNAIWSGISSFVSGIWNGIINGVRNAVQTVANVISGIQSTVMGAVSGAIGWLVDVGKDIIGGLVKGVKGALGWIKDVISDTVGNVIDFAKHLLGIASPSKVFAEIGGYVSQGLANGIADGAGAVMDSVSDLAGAATGAFGMSLNGSPNISSSYRPALIPSGVRGDFGSDVPGSRTSGSGSTFNIYDASDPVGTALAVARRQNALAV